MNYVKNGIPFQCNYIRTDAQKISHAQYKKIVGTRVIQAAADQKVKTDAQKESIDYEIQVHSEMRAAAIASLAARGITAPGKILKVDNSISVNSVKVSK